MKPTKHLIELANKQFDQDLKTMEWLTENDRDRVVAEFANELNEWKKALLHGRFYCRVISVSKSGMSRRIELAYMKNNKLTHASSDILKLAGCTKDGRISGCGMDMLFAAQYALFCALCPKMRYQDKMKRYNDL